MNIFDIYLNKIITIVDDLNKKNEIQIPENLKSINTEIPPPKFDFDISTNVAMVLSKINKTSPLQLAEKLVPVIKNNDDQIETIKVVKPGFINIKFKLSFWSNFIKEIIKNSEKFGINEKEDKKNYLIEFVSANPTGPLHVGHCRGAILGDVIANILIFNKHKVTKEYYVNDYGNQIINFSKSIFYRIREIKFNEPFPKNDPDLYPGDYLINFAQNIISENSNLNFDNYEKISEILNDLSIKQALVLIKKNLKSLGINHDSFVSEKKIVLKNEVENVIKYLEKNNFVYKGKIKAPEGEDDKDWIEREQLLFKSTDFGDEKDRVVKRENGATTYFASDIAYHANKFDRGYSKIINVWGADHHGYLPRVKAAMSALGEDTDKFEVIFIQFANLVRGGKKLSMSTRAGEFISLNELIEEVTSEAARFFFINRKGNQHLDFDLDLAKEESKDNPLYYIQYAHARICSVFDKLKENKKSYKESIALESLDQLESDQEVEIQQLLSQFPDVVNRSAENYEPHLLCYYLRNLAGVFHSYYNNERILVEEENTLQAKLFLISAVRQVLFNGLKILSISAPESM